MITSERPTGKLRFVGGRLQQEWVTEVHAPPVYTEEQVRNQSIMLQSPDQSFAWRDVPSVSE